MFRVWDKSKPPSGPFALNRDAWQAQGLVAWYPMGMAPEAYDFVGKHHFTTRTAITADRGPAGEPVVKFANGSSSVLQSATVPVYAAPLTIAMWVSKPVAADTTTFGLACFGDYTLATPNPRRFQFDAYNGDLRWLSVGSSVGAATKSGIVANRWHHMMGIEESTTSRYAALDGITGTQDTTSATPGGTQNRFVLGAIFDNGSNQSYLTGSLQEACVWNRSMRARAPELASPGERFALWYPLRSRKWISVSAGGGGTTHNVNLTESASATDSAIASYLAAASTAESITASDVVAALLAAVATLTEAASAADSQTTGNVQSATLTESASATETEAAFASLATAVSEPANATDLAAAVALAVAAVSEAISAADAQSTSPIIVADLSEPTSAVDAITAAALLVGALLESGTAADAATTAAQLVALLTETGSATDTITAPTVHSVSITELAAALDVLSAAIDGGAIDITLIRRVARSPALSRLVRSPAPVRSTDGL